MKKSGSTEKNIIEISDAVRIRAARNEVNYWKLRYKLLMKYGRKER